MFWKIEKKTHLLPQLLRNFIPIAKTLNNRSFPSLTRMTVMSLPQFYNNVRNWRRKNKGDNVRTSLKKLPMSSWTQRLSKTYRNCQKESSLPRLSNKNGMNVFQPEWTFFKMWNPWNLYTKRSRKKYPKNKKKSKWAKKAKKEKNRLR